MNLEDWQRHLEDHFRDLSTKRRRDAPDRRIFSLEHGLSISEIQDISATVRAHIAKGPPLQEHALPWIVYATEFGYRYSGDQYWQTFEEETPYWTINGDRYWIRSCYIWFQKEFSGVVPCGAWAKHFSIICWPITHAILPKDLQKQLAHILYDLRHSFSAEVLETPSILGDLIESRSWNASSRFQNFAQETELVGQIASALLLHEECSANNLIHPGTLKRIAQDLECERLSREWLRGARRIAKDRTNVRGLGLWRQSTKPSGIATRESARAEIAELGIEPRLVIRPTDSTHISWEVSLEIPDLSHLIIRFPKTKEILTGSRCVVAGAAGRPLARGRCLYGAQRVILSRWPRNDEVLLRFEQTDPELDYLLRTECLLRPGPKWLFRIASDGLAYECRSLRVRPGVRYIIVNTTEPIESDGYARAINLSCEGAYGAILDLPQALTKDWEEVLHHLGLGQAKNVEVWPAGLAAVIWDGEGYGEWLASERPCLGIQTDHSLASLLISMSKNPSQSLELTSVEPSKPFFIEFPNLPVGLHKIHISAKRNREGPPEPIGDLDVLMRIREARPWTPGINTHGPLIVQMEPAAPTLEQLWEGRVDVTIRGPTNRDVMCRVSLFKKDGCAPIAIKQLPPIPLPVNTDNWRANFEQHFRKASEAEFSYDAANICDLEFEAAELGSFTIRCEREFTPLRWAVRREEQGFYVVSLLDDSGDDVLPEVTHVSFETPYLEEKIKFASRYKAALSGEMYVARKNAYTAAIIVPPIIIHGLGNISFSSQIDSGGIPLEKSIINTLSVARLWSKARLPGDFISKVLRRKVLLYLVQHVVRMLCGDKWMQAECIRCSETKKMGLMKDALTNKREEYAVGVVLVRDRGDLAVKTCEDKVKRMADLAKKFSLLQSVLQKEPKDEDIKWISEFALRLVSEPLEVEAWAGDRFMPGLKQLMAVPTMVRAARLFVLATDSFLDPYQYEYKELFAGWGWT